jgi:hypothetical protein
VHLLHRADHARMIEQLLRHTRCTCTSAMEPWLLGAFAGGTAALAVFIAQRRTNPTVPSVVTLLRDRGPLTIPQIMEDLGLQGFSAQGKIVMALDTLVRSGQVNEQPVPPNTPTLDKIKVRKYSLIRA